MSVPGPAGAAQRAPGARRRSPLWPVLGGLVATLLVASLLIGPAPVPPAAALHALLGQGDPVLVAVMQQVRLPRTVLGLLVGASLGLTGAALQGFLRNPLAEPGLIGTSSAAALGAVLAIQTGLAAAVPMALPGMGLLGAAVAVALMIGLAGPRGGTLVLILAGIAVSAIASAGTALVLNLSPNPFAANEIVFWMMGSLADRSWVHVAMTAPFMAVGTLMLAGCARGLRALSLGEDAAAAMGVDLARLRILLIGGVAALTGSATAVAGAIGFVGLVVPHLVRRHVGADPARVMWASALGGAVVVLAADIAVRVILPGRDLKLGVLTALIGTPFFLHLILSARGDRE